MQIGEETKRTVKARKIEGWRVGGREDWGGGVQDGVGLLVGLRLVYQRFHQHLRLARLN